jgi:hypothetical protein
MNIMTICKRIVEIAIITSCMILVLYNTVYLLLNDKTIGIKRVIRSIFY